MDQTNLAFKPQQLVFIKYFNIVAQEIQLPNLNIKQDLNHKKDQEEIQCTQELPL